MIKKILIFCSLAFALSAQNRPNLGLKAAIISEKHKLANQDLISTLSKSSSYRYVSILENVKNNQEVVSQFELEKKQEKLPLLQENSLCQDQKRPAIVLKNEDSPREKTLSTETPYKIKPEEVYMNIEEQDVVLSNFHIDFTEENFFKPIQKNLDWESLITTDDLYLARSFVKKNANHFTELNEALLKIINQIDINHIDDNIIKKIALFLDLLVSLRVPFLNVLIDKEDKNFALVLFNRLKIVKELYFLKLNEKVFAHMLETESYYECIAEHIKSELRMESFPVKHSEAELNNLNQNISISRTQRVKDAISSGASSVWSFGSSVASKFKRIFG